MLLLGQGRRGTPRVSFLLQTVAGLPFGGLEASWLSLENVFFDFQIL
jgi:hypothetical protein